MEFFPCTSCLVNFDTSLEFNIHMDTAHHITSSDSSNESEDRSITPENQIANAECQDWAFQFPVAQVSNLQCEFCFQAFDTSSQLNRHLGTLHAGVKPFKCHLCLVAFARSDYLIDHLLVIHGIGAIPANNESTSSTKMPNMQSQVLVNEMNSKSHQSNDEEIATEQQLDENNTIFTQQPNNTPSKETTLQKEINTKTPITIKQERCIEMETITSNTIKTSHQDTRIEEVAITSNTIKTSHQDTRIEMDTITSNTTKTSHQDTRIEEVTITSNTIKTSNQERCIEVDNISSNTTKRRIEELTPVDSKRLKIIEESVITIQDIEMPWPDSDDNVSESEFKDIEIKIEEVMPDEDEENQLDKSNTLLDDHDIIEGPANEHLPILSKLKSNRECTICGERFKTCKRLEKHVRLSHAQMKPFKCGACDQLFAKTDSLRNHIAQAHNKNDEEPTQQNECPTCSKAFEKPHHLDLHMRFAHSEATLSGTPKAKKSYQCPTCHNSFGRLDHLKRHLRNIHQVGQTEDGSHKCSECHRTFNKKNHLEQHIKFSHKKYLACPICREAFGNIDAHIAEAHQDEVGPFECPTCLTSFVSAHELIRHAAAVHADICEVKSNLENKSFECPTCLKHFSRPDHVRRHLIDVHGREKLLRASLREDRTYECRECSNNLFKSSNQLLRHVRIKHRNAGHLNCNLCQQKLGSSRALIDHIAFVHHKIKSFKCSQCPKLFSRAVDRDRHVRAVHNNEKPHVCDHCGNGFAFKHNLQRHIEAVHNKLRDSECHICMKKYSTATSLKTHINTVHLKVRPHGCNKCDLRFTETRALKKHLQLMHQQEQEQSVDMGHPLSASDLEERLDRFSKTCYLVYNKIDLTE